MQAAADAADCPSLHLHKTSLGRFVCVGSQLVAATISAAPFSFVTQNHLFQTLHCLTSTPGGCQPSPYYHCHITIVTILPCYLLLLSPCYHCLLSAALSLTQGRWPGHGGRWWWPGRTGRHPGGVAGLIPSCAIARWWWCRHCWCPLPGHDSPVQGG